MIQMSIKNIENEILILDTSLDKAAAGHYNHYNPHHHHHHHHHFTNQQHMRAQKTHALDEARHAHEDLEFQLMEIEAKYETELEDIQNRLIAEQDHLLSMFEQRQASLNDYDSQQTAMLLRVKSETEALEDDRCKLIEEFKKQRDHLQMVEKRINQLMAEDQLINERNNGNETASQEQQNQQDTPSPASSSVSLTSTTNSGGGETTTSSSGVSGTATSPSSSSQCTTTNVSSLATNLNKLNNGLFNMNNSSINSQSSNNYSVTQTPNRYPNQANHSNYQYIQPQQNQTTNSSQLQFIQNALQVSSCVSANPRTASLSRSFRDILENTMLINGLCDIQSPRPTPLLPRLHLNSSAGSSSFNNNQNNSNLINKMNGGSSSAAALTTSHSINNNKNVSFNTKSLTTTPTRPCSTDQVVGELMMMNPQQHVHVNMVTSAESTAAAANTQLAVKFAELERHLALSKSQNYAQLEQQLEEREREMQLFQEEKRRREQLERQLSDEITYREKVVEENIKLRDNKKKTQVTKELNFSTG
jgi:hypothetical protein